MPPLPSPCCHRKCCRTWIPCPGHTSCGQAHTVPWAVVCEAQQGQQAPGSPLRPPPLAVLTCHWPSAPGPPNGSSSHFLWEDKNETKFASCFLLCLLSPPIRVLPAPAQHGVPTELQPCTITAPITTPWGAAQWAPGVVALPGEEAQCHTVVLLTAPEPGNMAASQPQADIWTTLSGTWSHFGWCCEEPGFRSSDPCGSTGIHPSGSHPSCCRPAAGQLGLFPLGSCGEQHPHLPRAHHFRGGERRTPPVMGNRDGKGHCDHRKDSTSNSSPPTVPNARGAPPAALPLQHRSFGAVLRSIHPAGSPAGLTALPRRRAVSAAAVTAATAERREERRTGMGRGGAGRSRATARGLTGQPERGARLR